MERRIETRQMLHIISLFLIAQFFGLFLIVVSYSPTYVYIANSNLSQNTNPLVVAFWFIVNFAIAIMIIMLVLRYYHGDLFFRLLEAYIIIFGSFFLFFMIIGDLFSGLDLVYLAGISLSLSLLLLLYKNKTNKMRNVITLITSIGAGVFIGVSAGASLGFLILYFLVGAFAVYDYIAVFVLKFMIPFAREVSSRNLAFLIGSSEVEIIPLNKTNKRQRQEYKKLEVSKIKDPTIRGFVRGGNLPMVSSIMLGNGDIMLPMMLAVGSYVVYANLFLSEMIILGSAVGLIATLFMLKRYKVGLPAIPPLFAFISLFLAVVFLIATPFQPVLVLIFALSFVLSLFAMFLTLNKMRQRQAAQLSS